MNNRESKGLTPKEIALKILEQQQVVKNQIKEANLVFNKTYEIPTEEATP